jgi:AmmeMemoRadiSam system protein A
VSISELGKTLLQLARGAIAGQLRLAQPVAAAHAALGEPGATFVTLTLQGELRGCIGSLDAHRPLGQDVRENALAAAFRDPRFLPLTVGEFAGVSVEVSLLTQAREISFSHEQDLLGQLRPGVDGIVFRYGRHRSTFLPQVWESLPDPHSFMAQLKRKAGLPADFWHAEVSVLRYEVEKWKEAEIVSP